MNFYCHDLIKIVKMRPNLTSAIKHFALMEDVDLNIHFLTVILPSVIPLANIIVVPSGDFVEWPMSIVIAPNVSTIKIQIQKVWWMKE